MLFTRKTLALAALLASFCTPTPQILVQNHSKQSICYKVEYTSGIGAFPNKTICGATGVAIGGFRLDSGQSLPVDATGFNGGISAVLNDNTYVGARNEINFEVNPAKPFWDVDYQYGISDGTCGPLNSNNLRGERDALGKANTAWHTLSASKRDYLTKKFPDYLKQDASGSLTYITMTIDAWPSKALEVIEFFQVTANFSAYMSPGSESNKNYSDDPAREEDVKLADADTDAATTDEIVITSY